MTILRAEMRQFMGSSVRVHIAPPEIEPQGTLRTTYDAMGRLNQPMVEVMRGIQDGRFRNLLEVDLLGRPGQGKTTEATELMAGWQHRAISLDAPIVKVFQADVARIFNQLRRETGEPNTEHWDSSIFDEVNRRIENETEPLRDEVRRIRRQGGNAIVLAEICGTEVTLANGTRRSRGARVWKERVEAERGLPSDERTTLAVAFVASSSQIPERAGDTREVALESQGRQAIRRIRDEHGVHVVGLRGDVSDVFRGAPRGTINLVEGEMREYIGQIKDTSAYKEHLRTIQTHNPLLSPEIAQEAAAWATTMHDAGTLGAMDGCSTVVINEHKEKLRIHFPR